MSFSVEDDDHGKDDLFQGGRLSHLFRPARYQTRGRGFESQCLRCDRLIFGFHNWGPALAGGM